MSFVNLQNLIGIGKGSLSNHLDKMGSDGYIVTRTKATFSGDRTVVEITDKGMKAYNSMLEALSAFKRESKLVGWGRHMTIDIGCGQLSYETSSRWCTW